MTIAIRHPVDPRALVEASQAVRHMLGSNGVCRPIMRRQPRVRAFPRGTLPEVITPGCMAGRTWLPQEVEKLEEMAGKSAVSAIAAALGRTNRGVTFKATELGVSIRVRKDPARVLIVPDAGRSRRIFSGCYPSVQKAIQDVSETTGVPMESMLSESRRIPTMLARRLMIYTIARDTSLSMMNIGKQLRLDHTTVLHAIRKEDARLGTNVRALRSVCAKIAP